MRIVHVSDIHFGTETAELVAGLVERVRGLAPDLIIASGDFTMAGRPREFIPAARLLGELGGDGTPVIATPGNHDLRPHTARRSRANSRIWRRTQRRSETRAT